MVSERSSRREKSTRSSGRLDRKRKKSGSRSKSPAEDDSRSRKGKKTERPESPADNNSSSAAAGGGGGASDSLSVDETNKLRAQLGLAPLVTDAASSAEKPAEAVDENVQYIDNLEEEEVDLDGGEIRKDSETGRDFVHRAADRHDARSNEEKLREKVQTAKEKRQLLDKMARVKRLAEEEEEETTADWVNKLRAREEQKRLADQRAKMLQEMDDEFGVGDIVKAETRKEARPAKKGGGNRKQAAGKALTAGLTVKHSKEAFTDGSTTVLVLEDKDVLNDDEEEALVNPTIVENEKWSHNVELRQKKPGYNPYEEDQLDDMGVMKRPSLLEQYDNVEDTREVKSFRIDERGEADLSEEQRRAKMKAELAAANNIQSLVQDKFKIASEYYTSEEMAFKKTKKKRVKKGERKRGGGRLKADDLLAAQEPTAAAEPGDADFGSRARGRGRRKAKYEGQEEEGELATAQSSAPKSKQEPAEDMDMSDEDDEGAFGGGIDDAELAQMKVEDDWEDELSSALDRTRKLKSWQQQPEVKPDAMETDVKRVTAAERIAQQVQQADQIKQEPDDESEVNDKTEFVTMDSTAEYCRGLGESLREELEQREKDMQALANQDEHTHKRRRKERKSAAAAAARGLEAATSSKASSSTAAAGGSTERQWKQEADSEVMQMDDDDIKWEKPDEEDSSDDEGGAVEIFGGTVEKKSFLGLSAALKMAADKGYIAEGQAHTKSMINEVVDAAAGSGKSSNLSCARYSINDKLADLEDKYQKKLEWMDKRANGPTRAFDEKDAYKPKFHLSYVDQGGKQLNQKEAWRQICWKFHGRYPGKRQTEKRHRKNVEEELVKRVNREEMQIGTLTKQLDRQKKSAQPYVVLSGPGGYASATTSLSKKDD